MNQAIVVLPWRPAPSRIPAFERVVAWYARHLPELTVTTVDTDDEPFVLAACRNRAIREAPAGAVVVINDADTLPEVAPLRAAIAAAAGSPFVHLPYTEYRWLGAHGSAQVADGAWSIELDASLAVAAQEIFQDDPQVEVLAADWSTLRNKGPYSLLFLDPSVPEDASVDAVADLVEPGGIVVLDDFAPCEMWPPITAGRVDILRETWLTDERFTAVEVMVAPDASALIATRR